MKYKLGILGSFGSGNIGDEAAWLSVKQYFIEKDERYKWGIYLFRWGHPHMPTGHHAQTYQLLTIEDIDWINNNLDCLIITGGGIINWNWGMIVNINLKIMFDKITIPIYCISISAEPGLYHVWIRDNIEFLFNKSRIFTVRNEMSQDAVKSLIGKTIEITPDIVTALQTSQISENDNKILCFENLMVIPSQNAQTEFCEWWRQLYLKLTENEDKYDVIPFDITPNDITVVYNTKRHTGFEFWHPQTALKYIQEKYKFIIAGRLHACVFAAMSGKPFFAIAYHHKIQEFCKQIGWPWYYPKNLPEKNEIKYGFKWGSFNLDECLTEIKKCKLSGDIPNIQHNSRTILNKVWEDLILYWE